MREATSGEIKKVEPPPDAPVTWKCRHCDHRSKLDNDRSRLFLLGLLPVRCEDCERMLITNRLPGLVKYVRGWC